MRPSINATFGMWIASASLCGLPAHAERADQDKPTIVDAARGDGEERTHVYSWTGDVRLTKGTLTLSSDALTIRQDPEGYNFAVAIVTRPERSTIFRQKRDVVDQTVEGRARRIEYDERPDTVTLIDRAVLKMLRSGRDADEARGDRIVYDARSERYRVESTGPRKSHFVLQPKTRADSDEASAVPVRLRASPAIESGNDAPIAEESRAASAPSRAP